MMIFFIGFTFIYWSGEVDHNLLKLGVFGKLGFYNSDVIPTVAAHQNIKSVMPLSNSRTLFYTLVAACFWLNIILKFPGLRLSRYYENLKKSDFIENWSLVRLRFFGGILIFIIPAGLTFILTR